MPKIPTPSLAKDTPWASGRASLLNSHSQITLVVDGFMQQNFRSFD